MNRTRTSGAVAAVLVGVWGAAVPATAHVDYVTDDRSGGSALALFEAVFTSPTSLAILAAGGLATLGLVGAYLRFGSIPDVTVARRTLQSYRPYLPWMLRLSVGLPLVGAGFAGYLFSPVVAADARLLQVSVGFLLLFGLATRLVAAVGLLAYLAGLFAHFPEMLLASEYVAGFLAILVVGPGQPSADMLIRRLVVTDGTLASRFRGVTTPGALLGRFGIDGRLAPLVLRAFLGLNFIYLGVVQKWLQPNEAAAVVAKYGLTDVIPVSAELWIFGAGLVEAGVGLAILTGTFTRGAAAAGFLVLTTTLFGLPDDPVLAHITLFGLSSALLVTGSGRFSLDASVVPALRRRLDPDADPAEGTPAD
jgi:uncharacterized membrane protein YphA (DoxX/SURF4 family)